MCVLTRQREVDLRLLFAVCDEHNQLRQLGAGVPLQSQANLSVAFPVIAL